MTVIALFLLYITMKASLMYLHVCVLAIQSLQEAPGIVWYVVTIVVSLRAASERMTTGAYLTSVF
jgi:hypothetical protein